MAKIKDKKQNEALARALADYQNLVKRVEREKIEIYTRSSRNLIEELLPGLDILETAQAHLKDPGLEVAQNHFAQALEKAGLEEIKVLPGDTFNANCHEAVETKEGGEAGTIAHVVRTGYKWKDGMVLRPTKVEVYK